MHFFKLLNKYCNESSDLSDICQLSKTEDKKQSQRADNTNHVSTLCCYIHFSVDPLVALVTRLGPHRLSEGRSVPDIQVEGVDVSPVHVIPERHAEGATVAKRRTDYSCIFIRISAASFNVDVVT